VSLVLALSSRMTKTEELAREVARRYDDTGALEAQLLAALARRVAASGKTCSICGERKPLSAFGTDSTRADGLEHRCRRCRSRPRRAV
jgi:hypothetical protein